METNIDNDYKLIPMAEIDDEARQIAVMWAEGNGYDWIGDKHKLASDIMNYSRRKNSKLKAEIEEKDKIIHGQAQINSDYVKEIEELKICEINLDISDKAYNQLNNEYQELLSSKENEAVEFLRWFSQNEYSHCDHPESNLPTNQLRVFDGEGQICSMNDVYKSFQQSKQ